MLTEEKYISSRSVIRSFEALLWNDGLTVKEALLKGAELAGTEKHGRTAELNDIFGEIFGWRLILSENEDISAEEKFADICPQALRNIIKSLFMEWSITGWVDGLSAAENFFVFAFSAAVMIKAYKGAAAFVSTREELVCSVSDIAGALYSDREIPVRISKHLFSHNLMNMQLLSYIL